MKAARINAYGDAASFEEVPLPTPGPDEVLVRVRAASLNPLDVKLASGAMNGFFPLSFPYTMGTDLAGTVERAGPLAARWRPGDRVVSRLDPMRGGGLAEFVVVPAVGLASVPAGTSLTDAAGVPTAACTAWQALFEVARLRPGQTVLIHAGAGGVGSFAIQLARIAGARVVATASGTGIEISRELGADRVIDYRSEDFAEGLSDVDVVLDTIAGDTGQRSFGVLRRGGVLVAVPSSPSEADEALAKAHGVTTTFVYHQSDASRLGVVLGLLDVGALRLLTDRVVPLAQLGDAFAHQGSGRARGKIILSVE
jgi:NADPH:quinone reductase-like Zn-dependent oxidoreductase